MNVFLKHRLAIEGSQSSPLQLEGGVPKCLTKGSQRSPLQLPRPSAISPGNLAGFTIIELLAVITLMAMLIVLTFGAAQYVIRTAHNEQAATTATALQVAITSYRHEYGQWPTALAMPNGVPVSGVTYTNGSNGNVLIVPGSLNYLVFDVLRSSTNATINTNNANNVSFIDNSTVLAEIAGSSQSTRRYLLPPDPSYSGLVEPNCPIVYIARDGSISNYSVTISFDLESATVTP